MLAIWEIPTFLGLGGVWRPLHGDSADEKNIVSTVSIQLDEGLQWFKAHETALGFIEGTQFFLNWIIRRIFSSHLWMFYNYDAKKDTEWCVTLRSLAWQPCRPERNATNDFNMHIAVMWLLGKEVNKCTLGVNIDLYVWDHIECGFNNLWSLTLMTASTQVVEIQLRDIFVYHG